MKLRTELQLKYNKMTNKKTFLTLEEAMNKARHYNTYKSGVYEYSEGEVVNSFNGHTRNRWTLVEDGKVLVEGVDDVRWFEKGVYAYRKKHHGWTLIEHGKVLAYDKHSIYWYALGVYKYSEQYRGYWLVENRKTLLDNIYDCHWYEPGVYSYEINGKGWTLIEHSNVPIKNVDHLTRYKQGHYTYDEAGIEFEVKDGVTTKI